MPQNPHAQFDETVLDLIEHSPTGVVPHTPTYADAVTRLKAAQQIYAHADHKDGYVTARALAKLPVFVAANWGEYVAGQIADTALESNAAIYSRYVASLPAERRAHAEALRFKIAGKPTLHRKHGHHEPAVHDPVHSLFLLPGSGPNRGLTGNYLHGMAIEAPAHGDTAALWVLQIHDSHDGLVVTEAPTLAEIAGKLEEVVASAPFYLHELEALGFAVK